MISKLKSLGEEALKEISQTNLLENLESLRIRYLGKKGSLSDILKGLGSLSPAERPTIGSLANQLKHEIDQALENKKCELEKQVLEKKLKEKTIDPAIPSRLPHRGSLHVVTQTTRKLIQVFSRLGFDVMTGPEVETEFLNFEAVNIPKDHPARDMQDTFFLGPGVVLRTHTSSVQMRALRSKPWPVRILCPGAVFRCD
ncbi:MAG: phenylalanine--tRNA ligase subunit alpha, partial [Deltaproteobacteria bacterium]|nr:phenylalanine--tRNA ligase subunit alpha [Deltaproteobacteria bacterium]